MNLLTILNLCGLVINMIGAYLMYHYTPRVNSQVYLYQQEEAEQMWRKDQFKQRMIRLGMLLLFIGFILQLGSLLAEHL
jgi:hypothetical protein